MMTDRKLNTREEADARYKWAIEDLYKDDEDWKRDYELLKSRIPELTKFRGRLGESAGRSSGRDRSLSCQMETLCIA